MQGKPFVFLGVSADKSLQILHQTKRQNGLNWRNFWDGPKTPGPIALAWNVNYWPTNFIIDARGVIRARDQFGPALDRIVDDLVREAEGR